VRGPATDRRVPEVIAFSLLAACAALMAAGYGLDLAGLSMSPWLLAVVVAASAASFAFYSRPRSFSSIDRADTIVFFAVVIVCAAYLLYLASPALLPITIGPDLVHHLQLIHVIQRTHRLAHDAALEPFLVEMMNYTPGSHILAATVAEWCRADALRLVQPIAAIFVALKMGLVYLLARRAGEAIGGSRVGAVAAPLLAFVPAVYTLGSTFHFFFYAQVVSETFAIGMLLAAVCAISAIRRPDVGTGVRESEEVAFSSGRPDVWRRWCLVAFASCGIGVFLSWPVWLGPPVATLGVLLLVARVSWRERLIAATIAVLPIVIVVAVHSMRHAAEGRILAASGTVTSPSVAAFGIGFLLCAAAGVALSVRVRAALPVVIFLAFTLLQSFALAALAVRAGTRSLYMPFKMVYLAVFPAAVLGALALMWVAAWLTSRRAAVASAAPFAPLVVGVLLLVGRVPVTRQAGPIVPAARDAAVWVRARTAPACVDYFTTHWLTGYWLHLDVLGNPRVSDRMRAETFEFRDTIGKWIEGRGLPYGIVEDLSALPRELRPDVTPVHRAGRFVVIRNHRPAPCP
jgi:hypothetical protein